MKMIFLGLALFVGLQLSAQNQYGTVGLNFSSFIDWRNDLNQRQAKISPGGGGCLGYFREKIKNGKVKARYGIDLNYCTAFGRAGSGGLLSSTSAYADVKKVSLGLNYYPLNFQVTPNFQLNFGARVSARIMDFSEGTVVKWHSNSSNSYGEFGGETSFFDAGILARAAIKIPVGKKFSITPESVILVGATEGFKTMNKPVRLLQHQINIGFKL
ncbi:MAG: hypothetical protein JNJ57_09025 [Saprospiraceae bacterium]|nr:hypothetical protein [Saprospiraceae bacterium]